MALIHTGVIQILNQPKMIADISSRTVQASYEPDDLKAAPNAKESTRLLPHQLCLFAMVRGYKPRQPVVGGKASVSPCVRRTSGGGDIFNFLMMHRRYCCSLTHGSPVPKWMCAASKDLWTAAFQQLSALLCLVAASGPSG